ncbi:MAG: FecR family protein [Candidatus Margulisiibacteriota bacterium]
MRRIAIILTALMMMIGVTCWAVASDKSPVASLTFYMGEVQTKPNGSSEWLPVKKGMPFYEGDLLKTLQDGKAELFFYTGSKVRIANGTEIQFTKDEKNKSKSVFLNAGQIWNQIRKGDKFQVESVHGVASVKGTEFDVAANKDEMNIWVAEGLVLIHNQNGQTLAERNTQTTVSKDSKPGKKDIRREDIPNWKNDFVVGAVLTLSAPGNKIEGKPFRVNLLLRDQKTDKEYVGEMIVNIKALTKGLEFATNKDSGSWTNSFECKIIDGKSEVWVRGPEGEHELNFTGGKISGLSLPLKIDGVVSSRVVELKFMGKDLKEHQIHLKYKLK